MGRKQYGCGEGFWGNGAGYYICQVFGTGVWLHTQYTLCERSACIDLQQAGTGWGLGWVLTRQELVQEWVAAPHGLVNFVVSDVLVVLDCFVLRCVACVGWGGTSKSGQGHGSWQIPQRLASHHARRIHNTTPHPTHPGMPHVLVMRLASRLRHAVERPAGLERTQWRLLYPQSEEAGSASLCTTTQRHFSHASPPPRCTHAQAPRHT